jgi:hypothetical protein
MKIFFKIALIFAVIGAAVWSSFTLVMHVFLLGFALWIILQAV